MPDKWAQYAVPNDKWAQYAQPSAAPQATPPPAPLKKGFISSALDATGLPGLYHAVVDPETAAEKASGYESYNNLPGRIVSRLANGVATPVISNAKAAVDDARSGNKAGVLSHAVSALPVIGPVMDTAVDQYGDKNYAGEAGTLAGFGASMLAPKVLEAAGPVLRATGEAAQDAGAGIMNRTAGSLKADFKRGANPGRAYLDSGGGPALSMQSLASKAADLKSAVGSKTASVRQAATDAGKVIPVKSVLDVINPPIAKAVSLEMGPGGMNNVAPIQRYAESFAPSLNDANNAGGFTPNSLFEMKKGIAENTNWSDPSQFSLKSVRQQQAGGLGGLLGEAVPELKPLNSQYQGLKKFAARAQERADTHSVPLSNFLMKTGMSALGAGTGELTGHPVLGAALGLATDSVPFKTTLASGLYRGGSGLRAIPSIPGPRLYPAAMAIPGYRLNAGTKKQDANDGQ